MQNEIESRIKSVIIERLGIEESKIVPEASFIKDLGADSLDLFDLIVSFEEEFGIEIPDEESSEMKRVKDVIEYVEEKVNKDK